MRLSLEQQACRLELVVKNYKKQSLWRNIKKAQGLCGDCGSSVLNGRKHCSYHLKRRAQIERKRWQQKRIHAQIQDITIGRAIVTNVLRKENRKRNSA